MRIFYLVLDVILNLLCLRCLLQKVTFAYIVKSATSVKTAIVPGKAG